MGCQMVGHVRPADDGLHEVGGVAANFEGACSNRREVRRRPGRSFRAFDDDGVAGEDGGYNGVDEVVKLTL